MYLKSVKNEIKSLDLESCALCQDFYFQGQFNAQEYTFMVFSMKFYGFELTFNRFLRNLWVNLNWVTLI